MEKLVKLKNGAVLLYQHNNQSKATAFRIGISRGGDLDDNTGISHVFEHMLFKGTKKYNNQELTDVINNNFVNINAGTSSECMYITSYESFRKIKPALQICAEMLLNSTFPEEELEKEKQVIRQEIIRKNDNMYAIAYDGIIDNAYVYPEITSRTLGSEEKMLKITQQDLINYRNKNLVRENFYAAVCSNLPCYKIKNYINKYFLKYIPSGEKNTFTINDYTINGSSNLFVRSLERSKVVIYFGIPCYGYEDLKNSFLLNRLRNYWRGTKGELLNVFREKNQLAYAIDIKKFAFKKDGLLVFQIETSADKVNDCIRAVGEFVKDVKLKGITEKEAKRLLERCVEADDRFVGHPIDDCGNIMFEYLDRGRITKKKELDILKKYITKPELERVINEVFNVDENKIFVSVVGSIKEEDVLSLEEIKKIIKA